MELQCSNRSKSLQVYTIYPILTSFNQLLSIMNYTTWTTMVGLLAINLTVSEI
jgi:hypothetical protein